MEIRLFRISPFIEEELQSSEGLDLLLLYFTYWAGYAVVNSVGLRSNARRPTHTVLQHFSKYLDKQQGNFSLFCYCFQQRQELIVLCVCVFNTVIVSDV